MWRLPIQVHSAHLSHCSVVQPSIPLSWKPLSSLSPPLCLLHAGFARAYGRQAIAAREAARQRAYAPFVTHRPPPWHHNFPGAGFPGPGGGPFGGGMPGFPGMVPGIIGGDFDRVPAGLIPPLHNPRPLPDGPPGFFGGGYFHPPGSVPPGARYDPISPLIDPDGMSGQGGLGPLGPGRTGGRGIWPGRGRGRGGMFGGRFDPDSPDLPDIL